MSNRLAQWRNLSSLVLSSTQQLKAHQTSFVALHLTCTAMQSLVKQLWQLRISLSMKPKLYNNCILPIFLYGSECCAITRGDACRINVLHQLCLRVLPGIRWYHFVSNEEVQCRTNQPSLTEIIQEWHLTLFGHIARMDDSIDAKQIVTSSLPVDRKRLNGSQYRRQADCNFITTCRLEEIDLASRGSKWFKRTWTPTNWHGLKQSTRLRTDHCVGCWRLVALCTCRGACQRQRQRGPILWAVDAAA